MGNINCIGHCIWFYPLVYLLDKINKKGLQQLNCKPLFYMVRPKRFELLTPWFVAKYSIQLSYGRESVHYT